MGEWLDGPGIAKWAKEAGIWDATLEMTNPSFVRRLREWEKPGCLANVYTLDRHLTKEGIHLHEVPEELYTEREPQKGTFTAQKLTDAEKKQLVARVDAGEKPSDLAHEYNISVRSVTAYRGKRGDPWR